MIISGFDKLTLTNYPGVVACTIFTNGCNYKCPFCQNGTLALGVDKNRVPEEEVLDFLVKRRKMIDGICISGGEPTLQKDLKDFIKKVKEIGVLVKLDTNGSNPKVVKDLLDENLLDYIAMDIKLPFSRYDKIAGIKVNTDDLKESIDLIKNSKVEHEFRTTIIKEFHTMKDIEEIISYVGNSNYYIQNFVDSDYVLQAGLHGFTDEELGELDKKLNKKYSNAHVRGLK